MIIPNGIYFGSMNKKLERIDYLKIYLMIFIIIFYLLLKVNLTFSVNQIFFFEGQEFMLGISIATYYKTMNKLPNIKKITLFLVGTIHLILFV